MSPRDLPAARPRTEHDHDVRPAAARPRYRLISVQRPPRTAWERVRAWFGARFFEVETLPTDDPNGRYPDVPHGASR
jgi:hypothetical protein